MPVVGDAVSFHKKFNLIATVNYNGTLDKGHYTAYVKSVQLFILAIL